MSRRCLARRFSLLRVLSRHARSLSSHIVSSHFCRIEYSNFAFTLSKFNTSERDHYYQAHAHHATHNGSGRYTTLRRYTSLCNHHTHSHKHALPTSCNRMLPLHRPSSSIVHIDSDNVTMHSTLTLTTPATAAVDVSLAMPDQTNSQSACADKLFLQVFVCKFRSTV